MEILCYVLFDIAPLYHCFAHTKMSCWAVLVLCILKTADALKAVEGSQRSLSIKGDHPNFNFFSHIKLYFGLKVALLPMRGQWMITEEVSCPVQPFFVSLFFLCFFVLFCFLFCFFTAVNHCSFCVSVTQVED